eukprot:TRINITY_DN8026_c0_g1_i4.p3 TRINITY_DN8026_c0_g1~~TRINITY_DN8026_c0_g1_i4.p3  ORF type:complete len:242 (-),score=19.06 TRINITY_DN8026_c0_g1_i4:497-1222(-)
MMQSLSLQQKTWVQQVRLLHVGLSPARGNIFYRKTLICCQQKQPYSDQQNNETVEPEQPSYYDNDSDSDSIGLGLAGAATTIGIVAFLFARFGSGAPSLYGLDAEATTLDDALKNGKPTIIEFYANWCEVCQQMVPDTKEIKDKFNGRVNFVMLNVENSKWSDEISQYNVRGIPEYIFLDKQGRPQAAAVGRLPRVVLEGDTQALVDETTMPYASIVKEASPLQNPSLLAAPKLSNPRDHF